MITSSNPRHPSPEDNTITQSTQNQARKNLQHMYQCDTSKTCEMCEVACQKVPLFFPVLSISGGDSCYYHIDAQSDNKEN